MVAVIALVVFAQISGGPRLYPDAGNRTPADAGPINFGSINQPPAALPPATGNVDDALTSLNADVAGEESVIAGEEGDISLITSDSQEISDFGQSYQANDF